MVDWNDNKKWKEFREALQRVYPNPADLRIFVDDELNENLATIASDNNLQETAFDLIVWAQAKGRLDEVFEAFCRANPKHPDIAGLQKRSLLKQASNLREEDWKTLFEQFSPYDFADIQRAFLQGFQRALNFTFQQARPDHPPLTEQAQIQELLATYDNEKLAVRFVESAIAEIQRSNEGSGRDLTGLEQWRDRIAQQYNVPPLTPKPAQLKQTVVNWQSKKRKAFQEALQKRYPSYKDLEMFLDYELSESLAAITPNDNLAKVTYELLKWFDVRYRLDEVYEAFKRENQNHPLIEELERSAEK